MADGRQQQQQEQQRRQHPHGIRLAICLSQGCSVPPLPCSTPSPYACPAPPSANPNPANSFAVAVDACFIYCFFNPFLVDLLSLSFLLVRCSAPPFVPLVLASASVSIGGPPRLHSSCRVLSSPHLQHPLHQARLAIGKFHFCVLQFNVRLMNSTPFEMHRFYTGPESFYPLC